MGTVETLIVFSALMAIIAVVAVALDWVGKPLRHRRFIPRIYRFDDEIPQLDAGSAATAPAVAMPPAQYAPPIAMPPSAPMAGSLGYAPTPNAAIPAAAAPMPPRAPVVVASLDPAPHPPAPATVDPNAGDPAADAAAPGDVHAGDPAADDSAPGSPAAGDPAADAAAPGDVHAGDPAADDSAANDRDVDLAPLMLDIDDDPTEEAGDDDTVATPVVVDTDSRDDATAPVAVGPIQIPGTPPAAAAPAGSAFADAIAASEEPAIAGRSTIATAAAGGLEPEWQPGMELDERISGERPTLEAKAARFWRTLALRMEAVDANERHFNDRALASMRNGRPPRRRNPRTGATELPELIGLRVASDPSDVQVQWPSDTVDPWGDA